MRVARARVEKVRIRAKYSHLLNSRLCNSSDFPAQILLLTDFRAKERLLAEPFLPVVSFPGSEPFVLWFYMHPSLIVLPTVSFVLSKHRS